MDSLGEDGAFTDDSYAEDHNLQVGSPVEVLFPDGGTKTFRIKGIFDPPTGGSPFGVITTSSGRSTSRSSSRRTSSSS